MDTSPLRSRYPVFRYTKALWSLDATGLTLTWEFLIEPDHAFHPTLTIPGITQQHINAIGTNTLSWYAIQLGMVELLSYWKTTVSPLIRIEVTNFRQDELDWWHRLLLNGLGEFFYRNQIDFTSPTFVQWQCTGTRVEPDSLPFTEQSNDALRVLIPVGGGKDSAVTLEIFKKAVQASANVVPETLLINPTPASRDLAELSDFDILEVRRELDPHLLGMNEAGYLNGHTPFSAMAAWVSTLVAHLRGDAHVAVSNERSSNEGTVIWNSVEINHQYSKTIDFEKDFQTYITTHLPAPHYFSVMRPFYELQIGKMFATLTDSGSYVRSRFRSCNVGQKTNSWCGNCPKCLFAFLILRPFIAYQEIVDMFGHDVLANEALYPTLLELIGQVESKPFECVGTREESLVGAYLCLERYKVENIPVPILLSRLETDILTHQPHLDTRAAALLGAWNNNHLIPAKLVDLLKQFSP